MGVKIVTNMFFSPQLIYDADNKEPYIQPYSSIKDVRDLEFKPLPIIGDYAVAYLPMVGTNPTILSAIKKIAKEMHKDNELLLSVSTQHVQAIASYLTDAGIPYTMLNGNFLPIEIFSEYCNQNGIEDPAVISTLFKRLNGSHSTLPQIIVKLNSGQDIDNITTIRKNKHTIHYLALFLNFPTSVPVNRALLRLLREEHYNYSKTILKSQLKAFMIMKQNQASLESGKFDIKKHGISRKFYLLYKDRLKLISIPVLKDIIKCMQKVKSSNDLTLLMLKIKNGGETFEYEETEFI